MKFALDTNCFIDAFNIRVSSHTALQSIFVEYNRNRVELYVSQHTLDELAKKPDRALDLAKSIPVLPYWPIGKIGDLVGTIGQMTGTFGDMRRNEAIQKELEALAKSGNDIRDRGALVDALHASMDAFVTSDRQLVGSGPADRIFNRLQIRVINPVDAVKLLHN